MTASKLIINGEEQEIASKLHPICRINIRFEPTFSWIIEEWEYVDGAIVILDWLWNYVNLEVGILDVIVWNKTRTLQVFPVQDECLIFDGVVTWLLKLDKSQHEWVDDILFHWEWWEWWPRPV